MAHDAQATGAEPAAEAGAGNGASAHAGGHRLGSFLCWAVVFADIGTSVYYVPGILYGQVGLRAGLFVFLTSIAFLLLTLKYAEVSVRFPEGGGVVTVAAHAFNPWFGALGGMFILVDYFLTSAISSLSGVLYLNSLIPESFSRQWLTVDFVLPAVTFFTLFIMCVRAIWTLRRSPGWAASYGLCLSFLALGAFVATLWVGKMSPQNGNITPALSRLIFGSLIILAGLGALQLILLISWPQSASLGFLARPLAWLRILAGNRHDDNGQRRGVAVGAVTSLSTSVLGILGAYHGYRSHDLIFGLSVALTSLATGAVLLSAGWLYDFERPKQKTHPTIPGGATLASLLAGASLVFTAVLVLFNLRSPGIGFPIVITAVITVFVICFLGWLNWRGIGESARVSAIAAVAALVSDIVIIVIIVIHVPVATLGLVFQAMFAGRQLGGLALLTGFAGAFLAFSGLESISQLSPVMRVPRKRTVTAALALVFITVGVTSPVLTMFSTVLLTDPQFGHTLAFGTYAANPDPNSFISELAGAFGGPLLSVATAITAAALLIFACNTAIIGAYHVFVALSRMKFFPGVVERRNRLGTPYVAIILASLIPILVLIAVGGNVNTLGDLYAFGLLGAFSLTCLAMDVIRTRERRGGHHVGAEIDPELLGVPGFVYSNLPHERPTMLVRAYEQIVPADTRMQMRRMASALGKLLANPWTNFTYYIGFLTTALVIIAWVTNLFAKPDAAKFGSGITALGVGIAVIHYRYLQRRGEPAVFLDVPALLPNAWLVVLSPINNNSKKVIQAAVESASERARPLAFLYLAPKLPDQQPPRLFEIRDRFGHDRAAQKVLSIAKRLATQHQINAKFYYAVGGPKVVFDIARRVRPEEIVAEAATAKNITHVERSEGGMTISPEYVRYQPFDGINVAHYVLHGLYARRAEQGSSAHPAASREAPATQARPPTTPHNGPGATPSADERSSSEPESGPQAGHEGNGRGPKTNGRASLPPQV